MTWSIGDVASSRIGVISDPEILERDISDDDAFIVIGTDGIWEFLSNQEVSDILWPFYL